MSYSYNGAVSKGQRVIRVVRITFEREWSRLCLVGQSSNLRIDATPAQMHGNHEH
jgi:hypothetical protein